MKLSQRKRTKQVIVARLILVVVSLSLFGLSVDARSQTRHVAVKVEAASMVEVFDVLQKQTNLKFVYSYDDVAPYSVTLNTKGKTLNEVLDIMFEKKPLKYEITSSHVVISKKPLPTKKQQTETKKTIKGKVVDERGLPAVGVTVLLKGTKVGTTTNVEGTFSLTFETDEGSELIFSMIGMEAVETPLGNKSEFFVTMKETTMEVGEVVVTGIFNKPRESYTGAAVSYTRKQLEGAGSASLITSLKNLDPSFNIADNILIGSDPNSMPEITVRGASSLPTDVKDVQTSADNQRAANQPLFILDGFEITLERFKDLDESQVEKITILKDANATALYGSKGSNGVILITRKAIPPGRLRINYKGSLNIEAPDLSSYDLMNASEKLAYEKAAGLYEFGNPNDEQGLLDLYNQRNMDVHRGVDTYWLKFPVRTGVGTRHSLSVEGGDENLRYGAGLAYNNNAGAMKGSCRNVFTGHMFLLYNYRNFTFQNTLEVTSSKSTNSPYGSFGLYYGLNSYYSPFDDNGRPNKVLENFYYYSMGRDVKVLNPLYDAFLPSKNSSEYLDVTNNFSVEWHILPELFVRGQFSFSKENNRSDRYISADNTMFDNYVGDDYKRRGRYTMGNGTNQKYDGMFTLNYSKTFKEKHQIFGGLGATFNESKSESYEVVGEGISVLNMDFLGMSNQYYKDGRPVGRESISRNVGFLFNFQYTYDLRYYFDLNGKYDGSSQFGSENHFAPFWSTGMGWNLHNESFMKDNKWINIARLRASYGITGSQNFASYLSLRSYQDYGGMSTQGWYGVYLMSFGNPDLKWQKTAQYNLGAEIKMFDGRLDLTVDWYNKVTDDLLADVNLPLSSGFASYKANVGKVQNKGIELYLNGMILRSENNDFRWRAGFNLVHNVNTIKEISNSLQAMNEDLGTQGSFNPSFQYREGESLNTIYVVPSKGIDPATGKEIFIKRDGTETFTWEAKDQVPYGEATPKLQGTISTNIYWKGLTFNMILGYRWGGKAYNQTLANKVENIRPYENADRRALYDRWKEPGDHALYKSVREFSNTYATSRFVFKDNAFYGSTINLGYELPATWTRKHLGIEYLSFNGYLEDLFYFSTIKRERGTDYPFSRKFSFSITARF